MLTKDLMRLEMWKVTLKAFMAHPFLGWGPDTFLIAFRQFRTEAWICLVGTTQMAQANAHNDILQVAITMGLAGLVAYSWAIFKILSHIRTQSHRDNAVIYGCLAAAFLQAKVNPMPIPAIAMVAALAALLPPADFTAVRPWVKPVGIVITGVLIMVLGVMLAADRHYQLALKQKNPEMALKEILTAIRINPFEMEYRAQAVDGLIKHGLKHRDSRDVLVAYGLSLKAIELHPNEPMAYELAGNALAAQGHFAQAYGAFSAAQKLDPTFLYYLQQRAAIGQLLGIPEAKQTADKYRHILGLTK